MLNKALEYAARGWLVFPVHGIKDGHCTCGVPNCSDAGKHPVTANGLKDASNDVAVVTAMFSSPYYNVAVVTGKVSGITVVDIDVGEGKCGAETWSALIAENGEPSTLMAKTGSGGMHVYFKYNSALKTGSNRLGKGVDVRNDGGYVVAPPSLHRSGGKYEWLNAEPLDDVPPHLLAAKKDLRGGKRKKKRRYTLQQVEKMLAHVSPDDRDMWRHVGIILGREFSRSDEAWAVYCAWADGWKGKKGRNHDEVMREAFYEISQNKNLEGELSVGTIVFNAVAGGWAPDVGAVPIHNFVYFAQGNNYIYRPTSSMWVKEAVDSAVGTINQDGELLKASDWLRQNMLATSMTKTPALKTDYLKGFDCRDGELIAEVGAAVFNAYRRPVIDLGDAKACEPFLEHVKRVFNKPGDADQFLDYMAHRVQRPEEKPRFALLIAGGQGVGKDTAIEFCVPAIGAWNVSNIDPSALDGGFNEYCASTLVRINEAANLHDMSKWAFNERMKILVAGTPDHVTINPKYGQKYSVKMHCGVIVTTNHLLSGIYIPADDRRYDVIESATKEEMGLNSEEACQKYFTELWTWFKNGGFSHVAAFLTERDISKFSAGNGQRKTDAHKSVVSSSYGADSWLFDALDELGEPDIVRADVLMELLTRDGSNPKEHAVKLQPAMMRHGYTIVRNAERKDGRHRFGKKLSTVYALAGLQNVAERLKTLANPLF